MRAARSGAIRVAVQLSPADDNPDLRLLAAGVRRLGFDVVEIPTRAFFLSSIIRRRARIVHFGAVTPFAVARSRRRMVVRFGLLLAQVFILKIARVGIVWTVMELPQTEPAGSLVERWLQTSFARMADALVVDGPSAEAPVRRAFKLSPGTRINVIRRGHYIAAYPIQPSMEKGDARRELDLESDATLLLFLGPMQPHSGLVALITTIRFLRPSRARLIIVGPPSPPEMVEELRLAIGDDGDLVDLRPGIVPQSRVSVYMKAADVVVDPHPRVFTSRSLMLASTFGVPCIVSSSGSVPDYVDPSCAFLYDPDDPNGMRGALTAALASRDELASMGTRAREAALASDWESVAGQTAAVYRSAARVPSSPRLMRRRP